MSTAKRLLTAPVHFFRAFVVVVVVEAAVVDAVHAVGVRRVHAAAVQALLLRLGRSLRRPPVNGAVLKPLRAVDLAENLRLRVPVREGREERGARVSTEAESQRREGQRQRQRQHTQR